MTMFQILTTISLLMMAAMCVLYGLQLRKRDASLADLGWTGGMGLMAIFLAYQGTGWAPRRAVVASLVLLWSVRLFHCLLRDRISGKEEDARYQALRAHWGVHANRNVFWLFQVHLCGDRDRRSARLDDSGRPSPDVDIPVESDRHPGN